MNKRLRKDRREDWNGVRQHLLSSDEGWQEHQGILYYVDRQSKKDCKQMSKPYYTITVVEKGGRAGVPWSPWLIGHQQLTHSDTNTLVRLSIESHGR